jgi:hypothetical protein
VTVGDVIVAEPAAGSIAALFPVWLSTPSSQLVTVQYGTTTGTAGSGDFVASAGTVIFPIGVTTRWVPVMVLADAVAEANEAFELRLTSPDGATLGDAIGLATIVAIGTAVVQPPVELAVTAIANGVVTLQWEAPGDGPTPTGFLLTGGTQPGESAASVVLDASHRLTSVSLRPGLYFARLQTLAGAAVSVASNEVRIPIGVPTAPSAPAGLVGLVDGASLALAWRPTFDGGTPDGALLEVSGAASLSVPLGATDVFTFSEVPSGTYTFAVRSVNAAGAGPPSPTLALTFPGPCSGPPLSPRRLVAHRDGRALAVLWEAASTGPAPTSYVLHVSGTLNAAVPTAARRVGGVVGPGVYDLGVVAVNPCGTSPPTATRTVVVP